MIRFGGPVFTSTTQKAAGAGESHGAADFDPYELALAHKRKGYTAAYAPKIQLSETEKIRDVRDAFKKEGILIGEVGCWNNILDIDEETRKKCRSDYVNALALAEELGANCVVGLAGGYNHGFPSLEHAAKNYSEEAFEEAVEFVRYCIDTVKPKHAFFTYEIYQFGVVDSIESILKLIKAIDRKQYGVHLDLTNMINSARNYWRTGDIMRECIRQFGDKIVASHAKDAKIRGEVSVLIDEVIPGQGVVDIATLIRELNRLPQTVPYLMEHLHTEAEYDQAAAHIRSVAVKEGIAL